jgi:hypothetical protein
MKARAEIAIDVVDNGATGQPNGEIDRFLSIPRAGTPGAPARSRRNSYFAAAATGRTCP